MVAQPGPIGSSSSTRSRTSTPDRQPAAPPWRRSTAGRRRLELAEANLQSRRGARAQRWHQQGRARPATPGGPGRSRRTSIRPFSGLRDPGRPRPSRPAARGQDLTDVPPTSTRPSPPSARRWRRCSRARPSSATLRQPGTHTPKQAIERILQAGPGGQPRPHLRRTSFPDAPADQAGRGQAAPGPARPGPGRAEPPLLRRRQRDRRRGDPPQRQPRQQRLRSGRA